MKRTCRGSGQEPVERVAGKPSDSVGEAERGRCRVCGHLYSLTSKGKVHKHVEPVTYRLSVLAEIQARREVEVSPSGEVRYKYPR